MNHPLAADLSKISKDELDAKEIALLKRLNTVRKMNLDQSIEDQLWLILSGIEDEKMRRLTPSNNESGVVLETDSIMTPTSSKQDSNNKKVKKK